MKATSLALLAFLFHSCANERVNNGGEREGSDAIFAPKSEKMQNNTISNTKEYRGAVDVQDCNIVMQLSGHDIEVAISNKEARIHELPGLIEVPLIIRSFHRVAKVSTIDRLQSTCEDMKYKTQKYQPMTGIQANASLNPFTSKELRYWIYQKAFPATVDQVLGALDAVRGDVEISSSFLADSERNRLEDWFQSKLKTPYEFFSFITSTPEEMIASADPASELIRLSCGVLDGEAHIDFALEDKDGHKLTARVNRVEFN